MCVSFTGDGRPNSLTIKYAKGCDLVITEVQPEVVAVSAQVSGALPFIARNTIDSRTTRRMRRAICSTSSSRGWR